MKTSLIYGGCPPEGAVEVMAALAVAVKGKAHWAPESQETRSKRPEEWDVD
jgi:hypothetical protein